MKGRTNSVSRQDVLLNGMAHGSIDQEEVMKPFLSLHQADIYYVGKVGHVGVDFNATYYAVKTGVMMKALKSARSWAIRRYTQAIARIAICGQASWL